MNHEHLDILMNRAVDGKATAPEREELARALLADPTLRAEYDELMGAHISTVALFERLELPEDFTSRVMRRVQPDHVPTDADLTAIIEESDMPEPMPSPALASGKTAHWRRQAKVTTILSTVGALSAAAALLLAIGLLTGIIGSNKPQQLQDEQAKGQPDGPAERRSPAPTPAPRREPGTPGEAIRQPGVPDSPKPEKAPENPQPKGEEEEDKLPPVEKHPPKEDVKKEEIVEKHEPEKGTTAPENKGTEPGEKVDGEKKPEETPQKPSETPKERVEGKQSPDPDNTDPQPKAPTPPAAWGRMLSVPSGRVNLPDENGKAIVLDTEVELRVGMKLTTSANCVSVFNWRGGAFFAAGRRTEVTLMLDGFNFEAGEVAIDFDGGKLQPSVVFGAYALSVKSGVVLLVHKTAKKVSVSQSSGQSVLKFGEQTLVIEAGAQVDVEFGKMPALPKTKPFVLPEWCGVVRREINLARLEKQLTGRKLTRGETTSLQDQIERLGRLPHSSFLLTGLMNRVLELEGFSNRDLINLLGDVEEAFQGNQELTLDETIKFAFECTCEIKNYTEWSKRFTNKLRELSKRDLNKEKEAREKKIEEEKRQRAEKEAKDAVNGKKEEVHEGKDAATDKPKSEEERKKEAPKKD